MQIASDGSTRHVSTEEYRRMLTEWSVNTLSDLKDKQRMIDELRKQIAIAQRRVKGLTTTIENLTLRQHEYTDQIRQLSEQLKTDEMNRKVILYQISLLKAKLTATEQKLADEEEKLRDADHTLEELRDEQASMESLTEEMSEKTREVIKGAHGAAFARISDTLLSEMLWNCRRLLPTLDSSQREIIDAPMIEAWASNGVALMKCAVMLFLGYADQATQIAESNC